MIPGPHTGRATIRNPPSQNLLPSVFPGLPQSGSFVLFEGKGWPHPSYSWTESTRKEPVDRLLYRVFHLLSYRKQFYLWPLYAVRRGKIYNCSFRRSFRNPAGKIPCLLLQSDKGPNCNIPRIPGPAGQPD